MQRVEYIDEGMLPRSPPIYLYRREIAVDML